MRSSKSNFIKSWINFFGLEVGKEKPNQYIRKDEFTRSTLIGTGMDGRYIHSISNGRVSFNPQYYSIDGRVLDYGR